MRGALRAEWTKLCTDPTTIWLLLAVVAVTAGSSAGAAVSVDCRDLGCGIDPARVGLAGIQLGQAVVAVLAVLAVAGEHGTGMIRTTLTAVPRRGRLLAAKALVVGGVTLVVAVLGVLGSVLAARLLLPGSGFTRAHGYGAFSLLDGPTLRAVSGSIGYLVLIALLSVGVALVVRDQAVGIGTVLGLLYVMPVIAQVITNRHLREFLQKASPMSAGLAVQATRSLSDLVIGPWAGLGVLAAWAAGALALGGVLLLRRDAG